MLVSPSESGRVISASWVSERVSACMLIWPPAGFLEILQQGARPRWDCWSGFKNSKLTHPTGIKPNRVMERSEAEGLQVAPSRDKQILYNNDPPEVYRSDYAALGHEKRPARSRICGLRRTTFLLLLVIGLLVIIAATAGGVAGGLLSSRKDSSNKDSAPEDANTTSSPPSSRSVKGTVRVRLIVPSADILAPEVRYPPQVPRLPV